MTDPQLPCAPARDRRPAGRTAAALLILALALTFAAAPAALAQPVINELVANHTGGDTNEYLEVFGAADTDYSAYTLLELEGDSGSTPGVVDGAWTVGTTDASGLWATGFLGSEIENGTVSVLLVEGFSGAVGDDLDTDDDGVLDAAPWVARVDDVALTDGDAGDLAYAATVLGPDFDGSPFAPGGASRIPDGFDTDAPSDWLRNDFDGEGLPGFDGTPEPGEAVNTPGLSNQAVDDPPPPGSGWVINEIHADPASDTDCTDFGLPAGCGDANGDGGRDSTEDEFVEIVNATGSDQDISGWTLSDGVGVRHTFPAGTVVTADCAVVVFGGGAPGGEFGGALVQLADSGALGLNNSGDTVALADAVGDPVASVSYGSEGGENQSLTLDPDVDGTDYVLHREAQGSDGALFSPGTRVDGVAFDGCGGGGAAVTICEIQGTGLASPLDGQSVTTEGNVVTAVAGNGFYVQATDGCDADPESSDGLFVFTSEPPAVSEGDEVDVSGLVQEFFDLTELTDATVTVTGSGLPLPAPVIFDETTPSPDQPQPETELERYEGMLVRFVDGVTSAASDRFGDVAVVAKADPVFREPGIEFPGLPDLPVWDGNPELFEIDPDGLGSLPDLELFRDQAILECEGPLTFSFGDYVVHPKVLVAGAEPELPRPVRDRLAGESTIATLNLLRFFDETDDPEVPDDPELDPAVVEERLDRFAESIRVSLGAPDVLGVQEIENLALLERLAARIAEQDPALSYAAILEEGNDEFSSLDVGYLVRDTVTVVRTLQAYKDLTWEFDGEVDLLYDRPPLVLGARLGGTFPVAIILNHARSLSGIDDPADGDRVREKRFNQAVGVSILVRDLQARFGGNLRLLVTGDLNAFELTDGYVDVVGQITGDPDPLGALIEVIDVVNPDLANEIERLPAEERYTFTFDGSAQVLDHMLTSAGLQPFVSDLGIARGNVDAPEAWEEMPDPDRPTLSATDHDGMVLFVDPAAGE